MVKLGKQNLLHSPVPTPRKSANYLRKMTLTITVSGNRRGTRGYPQRINYLRNRDDASFQQQIQRAFLLILQLRSHSNYC